MGEQKLATLGPDQYPVRYYAALDLDLLGQEDVIRRLETLPHSDAERADYEQALRQSKDRVERVREWIRKGFDALCDNTSLSPELERLDAATRERCKDTIDPDNIRIRGFSDTIIAFVPVTRSLPGPLRPQATWALLAAAGIVMPYSLAEGIALRGAMDVRVGFELDDGDLYGPVALSVYHLERDCAQWPRVVVGEGLVKCLQEAIEKNQEAGIAEKCLKLVKRDAGDGTLFVDYLSATSRQILGDEVFLDLAERGAAFATAEHQRFVHAGNQKLAFRYSMLRRYYGAILGCGEMLGRA